LRRETGEVGQRFLDRDREILALASGRRVLHLGCVGHTDFAAADRVRLARETLHWKLGARAETVGVDYAREVVEGYRAEGIFDNIVIGDVERLDDLDLGRDFDLVIVADIIEHLSNPGAMLDGIRRLCGEGTRVIITTPHAFGLANVLRHVGGRFRDGADHVMTFNQDNIRNLLARHGFAIERLDTCHQAQARRHGALFPLGRALFTALPRLGGTLFIVASPSDAEA